MPQARISVNSVPGSNISLPINSLVALDNQNSGGELSFTWAILDQPPGPTDLLSATTVQNPSFTPKKEGTYLIRLIVNQGLPTEQEERVVCAIKQLKTLERIPAAGETIEADTSDGWATASNSYLRRVDTLLVDPGVIVGVNASGGTLTRGTIVRCSSAPTIKTGLPGQEALPGFSNVSAATLGQIDELLCVVESSVAGASSVPGSGSAETRLMKVRYIGRLGQITLGAGSASPGDTIYVNDSGQLSLTTGTIRRRVGSAMTSGTTIDIWFNGVGGADIDLTPIDRAYVVYGNPGALSNAFRVDGSADASSVVGSKAFTIKTGDDATRTLVLRRFSSSGLQLFSCLTEGGSLLFEVKNNGNVGFADWDVENTDPQNFRVANVLTGSYYQFKSNSTSPFMQFNLHDAGGGAPITDFVIEMGNFTDAVMRLGSSDTVNDGGLRVRIKGADSWLFSKVSDGLHLQAPGTNAANVTNLRAPVLFDEAARKNYVDTRYSNFIINGHFKYWQRAVPNGTLVLSVSSGSRQYNADRWYVGHTSSGSEACLYTQGSVTAPPYPFKYFARRRRGSGSTAGSNVLGQEIDRDFLKLLNSALGRHLTVQFWCRVGSAYSGTPTVEFHAGNGGLFDNAFTGYGSSPTSQSVSFTPTTSWAQYKAHFFTGSERVNAALLFKQTFSGASADILNDYIDITGVQMAESESVDDIAIAPFVLAGGSEAGELALCERYFEMSYNLESSGSGEQGALFLHKGDTGAQPHGFLLPSVRYRTRKWTFTNTSSGYGAESSNLLAPDGSVDAVYTGGADKAVAYDFQGETGFTAYDSSGTIATGTVVEAQYIADFEI